ncbi:MAG TPA: bifunctional transaldolase/phosoglucose isomerase [Caulobacteraceae bacterium]|jgi:transaldolase/glucose-6-phosphate isomerase
MPQDTLGASNRVRALAASGQAVWLDFLHRKILEDGELNRLIEIDGVTGLTSNPAIFEQAIAGGDTYDSALKAQLLNADQDVMTLYEGLAIADIQAAADAFRPVHDALGGRDGFVSLEVSPYLAMDTEATIAEARRLWRAVDRPNLMIKVPGTGPGVPAIRTLVGDGININVTLLFSLEAYLAVAEAHMAGLEAYQAAGGDISRVHGVASFFVSRIDGLIDAKIDARGQTDPSRDLRGKVAIANAKVAYHRYLEMIGTARWRALAAAGASPHRLLWASTGTKDPAYSDVLYPEALIGPDTVDTLPPKTLAAFRDHGSVTLSLTADVEGARAVIDQADALNLDLAGVTAALVDDGVVKFAQAFDGLLAAVADKRATILGSRLNWQTIRLPPDLQANVDARLKTAAREAWTRRLWSGDASLWTNSDEARWLGWLGAACGKAVDLDELAGLAADVRAARFGHAVLLGMGGSSLGPEVLASVYGSAPGHPRLLVLDSTDPAEIARVEAEVDLANTLFIVSSKSGSTLEPEILHRYFWEQVTATVDDVEAGRRFIAVTDPGSNLEKTARSQGFWQVLSGEPSIGGRFSVMSNFGLGAAAVLGLDLEGLLDTARTMVRSCGADALPSSNPAVKLGVALGAAAQAGQDKVTFVSSPSCAPLGAWLEQLLAESTGKNGKGLIPVTDEPVGATAVYGADRVFVFLNLEGERSDKTLADSLANAGHPVIEIGVPARHQLVQEFVRWEIAVAVAGVVLGVNPFDQPDVEASKVKARALAEDFEAGREVVDGEPLCVDAGVAVFAGGASADGPVGDQLSMAAVLREFFHGARARDYVGLLAWIDRNDDHAEALRRIRARIRDWLGVATVMGFGPRFLHSTGQAYKGGPNTGLFIEITAKPEKDIPIPGRKLTFGQVERAQALGDMAVLEERGRRVLRIDLGANIAAGLERLEEAVERALI